MTDKLFINKYQPLYFDSFGPNNEVIQMLKTLILIYSILLSSDCVSFFNISK